MPTLAIDWIRTTAQVKHYGNIAYDVAVRTGWVTGLDNDNNDDGDAIAALVSGQGRYHHNNVKLPLASVRSSKVGPSKCLVTATYSHGPWSIPQRSSLDMAIAVDSTIQRVWWQREIDENGDADLDANGLPNGPANHRVYKRSGDYFVAFEPYPRTIGITTWRVPFLLADDPATLVTVKKMRLNDGSFTIRKAHAQDTLAYLGIIRTPIDTPNGVRYSGEYRFLERDETHIKQYPLLTADLTHTSFPLIVRDVLEHPEATYTGKFPMNRGDWATSTAYIVGDTVWSDETPSKPYKCILGHTSSGANKPPGATNWSAL